MTLTKNGKNGKTNIPRKKKSSILAAIPTGNLLISKKVLKQVVFDPDYTFFEDEDFSARATQKGFMGLKTLNVIGFDINSNRPYSNIYAFDMPLKQALRGVGKKAKIQAKRITNGYPSISEAETKFFWGNKRYLFYIGYLPAIILKQLSGF